MPHGYIPKKAIIAIQVILTANVHISPCRKREIGGIYHRRMRWEVVYLLRVSFAAALAILISACSYANLGWLRNSQDVNRAFETLQVSPDYRYWYLYLENGPYAVLGLNRDYCIEDISWTEVEPTSETFRKVVELVRRFPVPGARTYGAYILDAKGERIGVWYSSMNAGITVDPDTKVVSIMTGTPWMVRSAFYSVPPWHVMQLTTDFASSPPVLQRCFTCCSPSGQQSRSMLTRS